MEYRTNRRTGDKIGIIGIGTGPLYETDEKDALEALGYAYEHGVNYVDFATAERWYPKQDFHKMYIAEIIGAWKR